MEKRKVSADGSITYKGKKYISDVLKKHIGQACEIKPILEVNVVWVIDENNEVICEARDEKISFEESFGLNKKKNPSGGEDMFEIKKLKDYKTEEIIKELAKRYGVSAIKIKEGCQYQVKGNGSRVKEEGPATVFVIREC